MPGQTDAYILREPLPLRHVAQDGRVCELRVEVLRHHGIRLFLDVGGPGPYHLGTFATEDHLTRAIFTDGVRFPRGHIGAKFFAALVRAGRAGTVRGNHDLARE